LGRQADPWCYAEKNIDITLLKFLAGVVKIIIISFAVMIALGKFGITIAPFIAALGAAVFGASFVLQGPLSNLWCRALLASVMTVTRTGPYPPFNQYWQPTKM